MIPGPRDVVADDLDAPFWDACLRSEFLVHRCGRCSRDYWPASSCTEHGGDAMRWVPASGRGEVHTWTVFRRTYDPELGLPVPYIVAVIQLDEGPFFHTNLVDCAPEDVAVGLPVEAVFTELRPGVVIPRFRPRHLPAGERTPS